jgi:DNA polymerase
MTTVHIDIESHSACDLKATGVFRYAEDPTTDLNVVAYASGTGPLHLWLPWDSVPEGALKTIRERGLEPGSKMDVGRQIPSLLLGLLNDRSVKIAAHNNQFERTMLCWPGSTIAQRYGIPDIDSERTICTMARAAVYGLPHSLDGASQAIGSFPKRKDGVNEMRYFSKPRKNGTRPTPTDEADRFVQMVLYCMDDVRAERDLDNKVPAISAAEQKIYELDQRINRRGVLVDLKSVGNFRFLIDEYKRHLHALCNKLTGLNPTQTGKLADWIRANGFPQLPDLQAPTVKEILLGGSAPAVVQQVLDVYSTYAMKAVAKYESMPDAACRDGRLRGLFKYYGAGPGRWSSVIVGLQNIARPVIDDPDIAIELAKLRSLDSFRMMYDDADPMKVFASCVRSMLISAPGKDLLSFDLSSIEAVICSWLAGDESMLQVFREGKVKSYKVQGSKMFGIPIDQVVDIGTKQLYTAAKIGSLACQFQGWEGAVKKMARQNGIKLTMPAADIAGKWREANPRVTRLWKDLEAAAAMAVHKPGHAFQIPNSKIKFKVEGRWLYMRLPSGRKLAYLDPHVVDGGAVSAQVSYKGVNTETRQFCTTDAYGGRWLQNACEGIGRDLLVAGVQNMERAGYDPTMTVHDNGVFEIDEGFGSYDEARALFTAPQIWADGMPVKADGYRKKRFKK